LLWWPKKIRIQRERVRTIFDCPTGSCCQERTPKTDYLNDLVWVVSGRSQQRIGTAQGGSKMPVYARASRRLDDGLGLGGYVETEKRPPETHPVSHCFSRKRSKKGTKVWD